MGVLAEALRQLDGRAPDTLAAALPELEAPAPFTDPSFNDPSFNDALAFADAAIQAADADEVPELWPVVDMPTPEPATVELTVEPAVELAVDRVLESKPEPDARDLLATVAVDRSYGRLWDSLTAALLESPPWAIVVAAADSREDSSWLLPAAVAFVQRHPGDVLLVDATKGGSDANRRGLSDHFGLACRFGLSDVLQATADWRDAVEPTAVPRVGLLARGPNAVNGDSALKASATNLLAELKSAYQLVLILAGDACDPLVAPLVAASDGTLLMLELGRTSRAAAERASSSLYVAGARLLGCVLRG